METTKNFKLDIQVRPLDAPRGNTLAFASVAVEDLVAINGIQVMSGKNGPFVTMPQTKGRNGKFHDIACPLNGDLRKQITRDVLHECSRAVSQNLENKQNLSASLAEAAEKVAAQKSDPAKVMGAPNRGQNAIGA